MKETNLPTITTYGNYLSSNYGAHCMKVTIPQSGKNKHGLTLYYSYETLVAFRGFVNSEKCGLFVIENYWGSTTGKHLNMIDGGNKQKRICKKEFEQLFRKALKNA